MSPIPRAAYFIFFILCAASSLLLPSVLSSSGALSDTARPIPPDKTNKQSLSPPPTPMRDDSAFALPTMSQLPVHEGSFDTNLLHSLETTSSQSERSLLQTRQGSYNDTAVVQAHADSDTNLVINVSALDSFPLGTRTPVILIHGIHSNQWPSDRRAGHCFDCANDPYPDNFKNLITALESSPTFRSNFKIFRFHYVSDKNAVYDIAGSLRNRIDADQDLRNKELVLIAHSMGGLVARSYMSQHNTDQGSFSGRRAGDRVTKLITLGTPHHGSPLMNGNVRVPVSRSISSRWIQTFTALSRRYWRQTTNPPDNVSLQGKNRKELLWDNFDGLWDSHPCYLNPRFCYLAGDSERNDFLRTLNSNTSYDHKITAYWGTIGTNSHITALSRKGPIDLGADLGANRLLERHEQGLNILGVLLQRITEKNFVTTGPPLSLQNDGMVPASSSKFDGHSVRRIHCIDFNHEDMYKGRVGLCRDENSGTLRTLFQSLLYELQGLVTVPKVLYASPRGTFVSPRGNANNFSELNLKQVTNISEQVVELRNLSDVAVQVSSLSLTGTDANQFSIVNTPSLPLTVGPQSVVEITVRFSPSSPGVKTATIQATNNSSLSTAIAGLEGLGIQPECDVTSSLTERHVAPDGGIGSFNVPTVSCPWTVSSDEYWIHASRQGQSVEYSVERNTSGLRRVGSIDIQVDNRLFSFLIYQDGTPSGCYLSISEDQTSTPSVNSSGSFSVSTPNNCIWSAQSTTPWIAINNPGLRAGSALVNFGVTANTSPSMRFGTITVEGQDAIRVFTVTQQAGSSGCSFVLSASQQSFPSPGGNNSFILTTGSNCQWRVSSPDRWLNITSVNNGSGSRTVTYSASSNVGSSTRYGWIVVEGNGQTTSISVTQAGTPPALPDINLPVTNANAGDALVSTSIYQSLIIQNIGLGYLSIGSIYRSSGSTEFEVLPHSNFLLSGESASITVKFSPTSTGSKSATFTVSTSDPDEPSVNFSITGNGVTQLTGGIDFIWANKSTAPERMEGSGVAVIDNNIYVLGSGSFKRNYKYDPTVNTWTQIPDSPFGQLEGGPLPSTAKYTWSDGFQHLSRTKYKYITLQLRVGVSGRECQHLDSGSPSLRLTGSCIQLVAR